jgi:uncharacterized protein (TIGR03435 family)
MHELRNASVSLLTGIEGRYWFQLEWPMEPGQTGQEQYLRVGPLLLNALREQLGLSLEEGRAKVETIVVDNADKLAAN